AAACVGHATADGDARSKRGVDVGAIAVRDDDVRQNERWLVVPPLSAEACPRRRPAEDAELDLDAASEWCDEPVIAGRISLRSVDEPTTRKGRVLPAYLNPCDSVPIRCRGDAATDEDRNRERLVDPGHVSTKDDDIRLEVEPFVVPHLREVRRRSEWKLEEREL